MPPTPLQRPDSSCMTLVQLTPKTRLIMSPKNLLSHGLLEGLCSKPTINDWPRLPATETLREEQQINLSKTKNQLKCMLEGLCCTCALRHCVTPKFDLPSAIGEYTTESNSCEISSVNDNRVSLIGSAIAKASQIIHVKDPMSKATPLSAKASTLSAT